MKFKEYINAMKIPIILLIVLTIISISLELSDYRFYPFYEISEVGYLFLFLSIIIAMSIGWYITKAGGGFTELIIGGFAYSIVAIVLMILYGFVYSSAYNGLGMTDDFPGFGGLVLSLLSGRNLGFLTVIYFFVIEIMSNIIFAIIGGTAAKALSNKPINSKA